MFECSEKKEDIVSQETQCSVPKGTTHLMMWIGGQIPESIDITKQKTKPKYCKEEGFLRYSVDYIETLKGECKEMAKKKESCILVYDSRLITPENEQKMKDTVKEIKNCYLVDYEDFANELKQQDITKILTIKR